MRIIFHLLMTPGATTTLEKAVQLIKGGSSHEIHTQRGHGMEIWQVGFHDWTIRDCEDYRAKVGYIRMNPVRAHLVEATGRLAVRLGLRELFFGSWARKIPILNFRG